MILRRIQKMIDPDITFGHACGLLEPRRAPVRPAPSKIERVWSFAKECIFKEFGSCLRHLWYRLVYEINPHIFNLNPVKVKGVQTAHQKAKIVLLLHGSGAHPSSFIPLARKLTNARIANIYTVSLNPSHKDPVPTTDLAKRIAELANKYMSKGYIGVDFALVGHSLGALSGAKYIWRESNQEIPSPISLMISISGRIKYLPNKFSWFSEDVRPEIEDTFKAIAKKPERATICTIWGSGDAIVPEHSAHFQEDKKREYTVRGWGHGGIVFASATHQKAKFWLSEWRNT